MLRSCKRSKTQWKMCITPAHSESTASKTGICQVSKLLRALLECHHDSSAFSCASGPQLLWPSSGHHLPRKTILIEAIAAKLNLLKCNPLRNHVYFCTTLLDLWRLHTRPEAQNVVVSHRGPAAVLEWFLQLSAVLALSSLFDSTQKEAKNSRPGLHHVRHTPSDTLSWLSEQVLASTLAKIFAFMGRG